MIIEGLVGVAILCFFAFLTMKLIDQWKLKRLRKKYPEGTETISRPVERMGIVRSRGMEKNLVTNIPKLEIDAQEVIDNLKEDLVDDESKTE